MDNNSNRPAVSHEDVDEEDQILEMHQTDEEFFEDGEGEEVVVADDREAPSEDDDFDEDEEGDQHSEDLEDGEGAGENEENAMGGDDAMDEDFVDDSVQGFFAHKAPVYAVAIHPQDQNLIATGGGDDKMYLWRADTGLSTHQLEGHTDSVTCVGFSADGQYVASGGMDGKVRVYRPMTGEFVVELEGPDELVWIEWHPKGNIILGGANDATIWMWNVPSGACMNVFAGHAGALTDGHFTPDGKKIVSISEDTSFIIWDPKTAAAVHRLSSEDGRFHNGEPLTSVSIDKDSSIALTGSMDGSARLINLHAGTILTALDNHTQSVEATGFCDVLPLAATAGVDGRVSIWDVQTFHLRTVLTGHTDAITHLVWHKNSPIISTCSADKTIRTWDARTGACLKKQSGHQDSVLCLAVSADGTRLISGSDDGTALIFDV